MERCLRFDLFRISRKQSSIYLAIKLYFHTGKLAISETTFYCVILRVTDTTQPENDSDVTPPAKRQSFCSKYSSTTVRFLAAINCSIRCPFRRTNEDVREGRSLKGITYHNYGNGLFHWKYENNNQLIQIRKW
ncbi:hypothetical protein WH47_06971 [Habropoda laboriosa]|uniref:Uncharacterized protein n=1 Tax=Habropoda laboriosa TaxID=597456 RepID=A0A0L7RHJ7_9HYME|nr:hypothetical protein WH47_06971 [Habropoda laboriosa]